MRNSENSSTRGRLAALTRIGLLVLIFAVVFATVLSCGAFGESATLNNGSVENVAEAGQWGTTGSVDISGSAHEYTVSVGGSTQTINGASSLYSTYQSLRIAQNNSTATVKVSLDNVDFTDKVSVSNADHSVTGYQIGTGSFGGRSSSNSIGSPGTGIATNVAVPSQIMAFISAGYEVTVSWTVGQYMTYNENGTTRNIGTMVSSKMVSGENARSGEGVTWLDCGEGYTNDGTWNGFDNRTTVAAKLSGDSTYIGLCIIRGGGMWRYPGMAVRNMYLTFSITKGTASDGVGPSFSNVSIEGDDFNGITIPAGETQVGDAYDDNRGNYSYNQSAASYTLGMVTGSIVETAGGISYYKSMSMDISDGNPTSVAFYHGIKSATLSSTDGVSATAAASASSGGSDNASNGLFRVEIDKITDSGTKSAVRVYFAANGTYTLSLYDNGSVFGGNDNHTDITIVVSGIDVTAPAAGGVGGTVPSNATTDLGQLNSIPWNTAGSLTATINGKSSGDSGSAWVYYFDVSYSFFAFTTAPTTSKEYLDKIGTSAAYPIAITNSSTTTLKFTYNTSQYNMSMQVGTAEPYTLSEAKPLSGTMHYNKPGYYAFMIYVADMAGNVCTSPFVYYIKVDTTGLSGEISTSYYYDTDGNGSGSSTATDWVNQYMVGANGFVYTDISFTLNPSGNIVTFTYGGNYLGSNSSGNEYNNFTATINPTSAGTVTASITGGPISDAVSVAGSEAVALVTGAEGQAALYADIKIEGSGASYIVTLILSYRRAADTEFGINHTNSITVKPQGTQGSVESSQGAQATVAKSASVTVKADTVSIQDIPFTDAGNYLTAGNFDAQGDDSAFVQLDLTSVAGRNWYTNGSAIALSTATGAYMINESMLNSEIEYAKYATYFGWSIYNTGDINGAVEDGIDAFKNAMEEAMLKNSPLSTAFINEFPGGVDGKNFYQSYKGYTQGQLLQASTNVNIHYGDAGVRVLYIMTLDQAGNANFSVYYLFVDTTDYAMSFEIPADYINEFSALSGISFTATDFVTQATANFKRGENIQVTVNGLPTGYVPYTVSKVVGDTVVEFYNQNRIDGTSGTYGMGGFIDGAITTPSDFAGGNSIAFVLDQAGNLGIIGDGTNLGLQFTFRQLVNLSTVTAVTYNGYAVADAEAANYDKTLHVINVTSGATDFSSDDVKAVRLAAYAMLAWSGNGLTAAGNPINAGSYSITAGVDLANNKYYISNEIESLTLTVNKRELDLTASVGTFNGGTYGDIKDTVFDSLKDDAIKGLSITSVAGVADLGQDTSKTLGGIISGSGLVLVNGTAITALDAFSAGNLNAGDYTVALSSACAADNYTFKLALSFSVTKRALEVTASGSKTYGSADGDITLTIGSTDALFGNTLSAVFPGLGTSGSLTAILGAGSASARNYTYENQGTDNYTNAGVYNITAVNVPSGNLSPNFTVVLKSGSTYTVDKLDVYIVPDSGQVITTLTGYNISYKYRDAASGGAQITDGRIIGQIVAGTFVAAEEFVDGKETYTVKVGTSFTLTNPEVVNLNLIPVTDGITITLDYDWDKTVITITFKVAPTATYMVNFDNDLLAYDANKDNFAYSYSVTGGTPVEGLPEGVTISWTTGSLSNYDAATAQADTSYTVVLNDIQIMKDGAVDDSGLYSVVVGATVAVERLHVSLTPSFTERSKVYGDADNWSGKYAVTASVADGVTLVDNDFLSTLSFTGQLGRALYNASGFVRAGAANDPVNALLGSGEYYGAYTVSSYTCDNSNVLVDDISVDVLKAIEFTVTARPITTGDVTAAGVNKPVPTGDANVPFTSNPFTINNMVAGDDVYIAYDSAVYVGAALNGADLSVGGIYGLDIEISGLTLAGDDAGNYTLEISGTYTITTDEFSEEGEWFFIGKYTFEGITSGDVTVTKVYDATAAITEDNFTISGVLKEVQDTFPGSFYILGRRYAAYDYRMQLQRVDAGTYTTAAFAFFVEGLSSVSFEVPSADAHFQVADSGEHPYNGMEGVYIVIYDTTVTIEQYQLQLNEIKLTPDYTSRYYDGTNSVKFTFAWADGADTTMFTSAAFTNLRLNANFTVASKNAGTYEGVTVSGFTSNPQSNFAPAFGNDELTAALAGQVITINAIPLTVTFAFVPAVYGSEEAQLSSGYTVKIDSAYQFSGWETELEAISIEVKAGTTKFTYWDKATDTAYPYVQYDEGGNVRLHDIKYEGVLFEALSDAVNLANYTFAGNPISGGDAQGSSGVIEAVAELTPKTLTFNTGYFVNISKVYDGTTDANELLAGKIGGQVNEVFGGGLVNGDDLKLGISFTAAYSGANVGTGKDIVMSGIALVANDEADNHIAKSYNLTNTSVTIQGCSITQAPLQVVFTLPTKTYDGTRFVDSVEGAVYYTLGGEYGDFKTAKDRSGYRVTYIAAGYDGVDAGNGIAGIFIGVELSSTNSSTVNYYLVDANGDELTTATYTLSNTVSAEAVARYSTSAGYEYLVPSAGGTSYTVIAATGTIEKAVYTVTVTDTLTKEFDNTDAYNGDLSQIKFTVSGLTDTSGITVTGATFASANAGTWDVTFTLGYTGTDQNYTVSPTAVAKGVITARTLTVSLADADFEYGFGGSAPVYADRLVYSVSIADTDYAVVVQGGVAYITEAGYKALAGADAALPSDTVTVDEVVYYALNGSVGEITLTSAAFRQTNGKWASVGEYDVTAISGKADNFVLTLAAGQKVAIVPATLTVSAKGDYEYVVDTAIADLEARVLGELVPDGITNGDVFASSVSGIKVSFGDLTEASAPASRFAITVDVTGAVSANYTLVAGANTYVTVVLPALSVTAKSGQSSIYDGADRLADADFLAALVNRKTDGVEKAYTFEVVGEEADFAIKNAGNYAFDIKVTCAYSGLDGYAADNAAYKTEATISVVYDVNKASLTIARSGNVANIYYNAKAQRLTDYEGFFAFDGAVESEIEAMLDELTRSTTYTSGSAAASTFTDAGAYEVALNATEGVFANYNVTSGITLLNVRKAPVNVNGTLSDGDINSGNKFGVTVTGVVPAEGCLVDSATVGKLRTTVKYSSGATTVAEITEAGVYNYVITLSDSVNYEIVAGGTLGASGTLTVTVKVVTESDSETAEKKAEVVFDTPQTKAWTLSSYELAETNSTYIAYSSEAAKLAGSGETVEIGGVVRLELVSGTTTINATTTGKLGETVEITVKLPAALGSSTSGYTVYERQKDGSLKEVTDFVVNDGYITYDSDLISDLVFVRIVGSGVPFWIWILVAVLAALIVIAIILAAFIGRKDRSTTPPPAAPPAEPPVENAPVSHDGALPAADVDIDIPDAPSHIGGGDRPPLIGTR